MKKLNLSFKTVYSRLLFFNLIIVILVTLIPQVFFISYFQQAYNDEISQNNLQTVQQMQRSVDEYFLEKIISIPATHLSELSVNSDLTYPMYNSIYDNPGIIYKIDDHIAGISSALKFKNSILIYYVNGNILFNNYGMNIIDNTVTGSKASSFINKVKDMDFNALWLSGGTNEAQNDGHYITYLNSIPYFSTRETRKAIIAITVSEEEIHKYVAQLMVNKGIQYFIVNEQKEIVTQSDSDFSKEPVSAPDFLYTLPNKGENGIYETKVDGKLSVISYIKSNYNGWIYFSMSSTESFYQKSLQLKQFLIVTCLVFLVINILASILLTRKAHKPLDIILKSIVSLSKAVSGDWESYPQNEYSLLDSTMKGASNKIDILNAQLDINKPIIRHNAISKLLKGNIAGEGNIHLNDELLDIKFDWNTVFSFTLKIYGSKDLGFENEMIIGYNLIKLLEEKHQDFDVKAIIDENRQISAIVNFNAETQVDAIIAQLASEIEGMLTTIYMICVGNSYPLSMFNISRSYFQACEANKYAYIQPDEKVLYYQNLNIEDRKATGSLQKLLERVQEGIRANDENKLKFTVEAIIESVASGGYTIEFSKNTLSDVVSTIRLTVTDLGYNEMDILGYDMREYFKTIENIREFKVWINGLLDLVLVWISKRKQQISGDLEQKIIRYVNENIYGNISLESLADALFMSPGYLSKVFKVVMGRNFNEYVTELKLERAVHLLMQNKLTVKEVSEKLGYNYTHYFIRVFKDKYGLTPKEYCKSKS